MWIRTLVVCALLAVPMVDAAAYMKLGDIKGEASDRSAAGHDDEIDVLAWSWGMSRSRDGQVTFEDVHVVLESDDGEFWFLDVAPGARAMNGIVLGASKASSAEFHLEDAVVSSYHISVEGDEVREEVAFYYNKISVQAPSADGDARTITFAGLE